MRRVFLILASSVQPSLPTRISSSSSHVSPAPEQLKLASQAAPLIVLSSQLVSCASRPSQRTMMSICCLCSANRYKGKGAIKWTRLSCRTFAANAVRLQLHALAYNLANFPRTLATPEPMSDWSLTTLKEILRLIAELRRLPPSAPACFMHQRQPTGGVRPNGTQNGQTDPRTPCRSLLC